MAIIMISRGTFSGGKALAERLADRLGYPCLSREETVREAVARYGVSEAELTAAMNEPPPFWQQVHGRRVAYIRIFSSVLLERVREANLVYHGHAAHLMLAPVSHLLRVRVIADSEFRIREGMTRKGIDREAAIAFIRKIDRQRDRWTRFLYGADWKDPSLYDAVFNIERMGIAAATEAIAQLSATAGFQPTAQSLQSLDDLILAGRVWSTLIVSDRVMATGLAVTANAGQVTIRGGASTAKMADTVAAIARQVDGVKGVCTDLGVGSDWYW